jgi:hypothetical protein
MVLASRVSGSSNRLCRIARTGDGLSGPTGRRLWRELRERGYQGGYTAVTDQLRQHRPAKAFAEEKPHLNTLPLLPFRSVLKLERRVSREGIVSVGGNLHIERSLYGFTDHSHATRGEVASIRHLAF